MSNSTIENDLRILLVEDHPFQLRATQYLLESYGFTQVTACDSARNALQHMLSANHPFDILLCDQCLPDIAGLDLIAIASQHGLIRRAILLSSLTCVELERLESTAHVHNWPLLGCLIKPLKQTEFRKLLNSAKP